MSEASTTSVFHRVRYTPMRDVVRGRLSARLDYKGRVASSNLPDIAKTLVLRIVKRTRLWSLERAEVTDELVAHFEDGLDSGEKIDELIGRFGNERQAVRLIRRAKKRQRPLPWHVARGLVNLTIALLIVYLLMTARFYVGRPSVRVDYVAQINRSIAALPKEQRGWPVYREVLISLNQMRKADRKQFYRAIEAQPGSRHWPELVAWLDAQQPLLRKVHIAADRPAMGFEYGLGKSADDPELYSRGATAQSEFPASHQTVLSIRLPHLHDLRTLASLLYADADIARQRGQRERFIRDIDSMLKIGDQLSGGEESQLVSGLVAIGIRRPALEAVETVLWERADLLGDSDLQGLAHRLSGPHLASDLLNCRLERATFDDAMQRIYTDDGSGDGRITPDGLRYLSSLRGTLPNRTVDWLPVFNRQRAAAFLVAAQASVTISRREAVAMFSQFITEQEAASARPAREASSERLPVLSKIFESDWSKLRYAPLIPFLYNLRGSQEMAERYLAERDGVIIAMALELYRRDHGRYPDRLDALVPSLLPAVPVDRMTGEPLCYRVIDGKPLIYSVGADRDDDGGRLVQADRKYKANFRASDFRVAPDKASDGDWILFPFPRDPPDEPVLIDNDDDE